MARKKKLNVPEVNDDAEDRDVLSEIQYRLSRAESFTKSWHDNINKWRNYYDGKHYSGTAKPGETRFVDPTFTNTVDLAVGILQGNSINWEAVGWQPSQSEQKGSSAIEKYIVGVIEANNDRNMCDIVFEVNQHFTRDGGACVYVVWDKEISDNFHEKAQIADSNEGSREIKKYTEVPVVLKPIDPMNIQVLPGGPNRWAAVCYTEERTAYDIESIYGVRLKQYSHMGMSQKMEEKGKFIDYWDYAYEFTEIEGEGEEPVKEEQEDAVDRVPTRKKLVVRNAVLFEDEFIEKLRPMKGYKTLPYIINFYKPTDRMDASRWDSIIRPLESTVIEMERSVNRRQRQIDMYSSLPIVIRAATGRSITLDPGMGNHVTINPGEDIAFPQWPGNPPDVSQQIDFYRARIQQSGFSDVMYGTGSSQMSGYAVSQLGDQNRIRLTQPITHLQQLWTWVARMAIDLTIEFASDAAIDVYGQVRGKPFVKLIEGGELEGYKVNCVIKPEFPNEKVRNHAMATQVKGILSDYSIMERYLGVQQPDDERARKLIELAQTHPIALQYALLDTLKEMAEDPVNPDEAAGMAYRILLQQVQMAEQQAAQQGSNPEQPMGLQSSTGQPSPQATGNPAPGQTLPESSNKMANAKPNLKGFV